MTIATTYEELKKYDRIRVRFNNTEGILYLFDGNAFFLSNKMDGASPKDNGEWKEYGYKHSWIISYTLKPYEENNQGISSICTISIDYNKLEEILC